MSCSLVISQMPQICVFCQYVVILTPSSRAAYSNVQVFIRVREPGVGSRVHIPTYLPVALDEDWRLIETVLYAMYS
jgi:hypothetical protein